MVVCVVVDNSRQMLSAFIAVSDRMRGARGVDVEGATAHFHQRRPSQVRETVPQRALVQHVLVLHSVCIRNDAVVEVEERIFLLRPRLRIFFGFQIRSMRMFRCGLQQMMCRNIRYFFG